MSFKKFPEQLKENLQELGITELNDFQKLAIPKIKSGAHYFIYAPDGSGKTTSIILTTINKLKAEAKGDIPRAMIIVKDKKEALELEEAFQAYVRRTNLRVFTVIEQHQIDNQKDTIFEGVDILIVTPKRMNKLFFLNGMNLNSLQLYIIEDAQFLLENNSFNDVVRIPESLKGCQYLVFANKEDKKFSRLEQFYMGNAQVIG